MAVRSEILANEDSNSQKDNEIVFKKKRGNTIDNKNTRSYMAQPNVKEFNKTFYKKAIIGRPYKWSSVEELQKEIISFLDLCDKTSTIPTVTAMCTWLHCNRDTFYSHVNNPNSPFTDVLKNYLDLCHTSLENGAVDGKVNSVVYIFMGKNYWNMSDSKEIRVTADSSSNQVDSQATMDAIQKQIEEENIPNADYEEE